MCLRMASLCSWEPAVIRSVEPDALPVLEDALLDDLLHPFEGAAADEEDILGVDLEELLVRVLAASLRRDVGDATLDYLREGLLHALAGDVPE